MNEKQKLYIFLLVGMIMMFVGIVIPPSPTLGAILGIIGIVIFMFPFYYNLRGGKRT